MNKRLLTLAALLLALVVLAGCEQDTTAWGQPNRTVGTVILVGDFQYDGITRFIDEEAGVVCWVYDAYRKGGLSCLPLEDTLLAR